MPPIKSAVHPLDKIQSGEPESITPKGKLSVNETLFCAGLEFVL